MMCSNLRATKVKEDAESNEERQQKSERASTQRGCPTIQQCYDVDRTQSASQGRDFSQNRRLRPEEEKREVGSVNAGNAGEDGGKKQERDK
jgi:hypothetical protein